MGRRHGPGERRGLSAGRLCERSTLPSALEALVARLDGAVTLKYEPNPGRSDASHLWRSLPDDLKGERVLPFTCGPGHRSHRCQAEGVMRKTHGPNEGFDKATGLICMPFFVGLVRHFAIDDERSDATGASPPPSEPPPPPPPPSPPPPPMYTNAAPLLLTEAAAPPRLKRRSARPTTTLILLCLLTAVDHANRFALAGLFLPLQRAFGASPAQLSPLFLAQTLAVALASPLWGWAADAGRLGRPKLLAAAALLWGLFSIASAFVPRLWMLISLRALAGGALAAVIPITQSMIADLASDRRRGRLFGVVGAAGWCGAVAGNVFSTAVGARDEITPFSLKGYSFVLLLLGVLSVMLAGLAWLIAVDPERSSGDNGDGGSGDGEGVGGVGEATSEAIIVTTPRRPREAPVAGCAVMC